MELSVAITLFTIDIVDWFRKISALHSFMIHHHSKHFFLWDRKVLLYKYILYAFSLFLWRPENLYYKSFAPLAIFIICILYWTYTIITLIDVHLAFYLVVFLLITILPLPLKMTRDRSASFTSTNPQTLPALRPTNQHRPTFLFLSTFT